jgi:hypothetical protein
MRTKKLNKTRAFVKAFIHKNKQNNGDKVSGFVKIDENHGKVDCLFLHQLGTKEVTNKTRWWLFHDMDSKSLRKREISKWY